MIKDFICHKFYCILLVLSYTCETHITHYELLLCVNISFAYMQNKVNEHIFLLCFVFACFENS